MSVYYYLFAKEANECIGLGCSIKGDDRKYEGPIVWIGAERFLLTSQMLELLIERFYDFHGKEKVFLLSEDELYDSGVYLSGDEFCIQVGSDEDNAPPLTKYIPELKEENIRLSIVSDEKLRL
ncbi:MAG: hypothetical protein Q7T36_02365 [Fluviicoccus sp.]|uniref:hypothetical protein n=1 Tax=Fluviicoccus sp. TaxID=2003552 RepID=UPI0027238D63|nr:hypothetical protein [Fluviicoccus sp.]MDO8329296.1 hypothetical protein [Fluviicoccus sp.]